MRVLNLWQKNGVFKIEVIQPLLDMAAGSSSSAAPYTGTDEPGNLCLYTRSMILFLNTILQTQQMTFLKLVKKKERTFCFFHLFHKTILY